MKSILVPIDFSECSKTAFRFALEIAKEAKSKIVLFHSFHVPLPPPEALVMPISLSESVEENVQRLRKLTDDELHESRDSRKVNIVYEAIAGFATDEIIALSRKHMTSLIVMGTEGATGIKKNIFGSVAANVIKKSTIPVLVVPEKAVFTGLKKIALAVDLAHIDNSDVFKVLIAVALLFESELKIFFVQDNLDEPVALKQAIEKLNLDTVFKMIPHTFHVSKDKNIIEAIDIFVKDSRADLLVTMPHKHSYFELLQNKSITRNLAFHVKKPLLSLPEIN